MGPAPDSFQEALDRLAGLDPDGALGAFDRWLAAASTGEPSRPAAEVFLEALSRFDSVARHIDRRAGLADADRMLVAQRMSLAGSIDQIKGICREAVAGIVASIGGKPKVSEAIARAREFVTANYTRKISLAEVARAAGLSPNYLSTKFRAECGATLVRYVHALRVEAAARLLSEGNRRITEVASLVGYQNYRDFHRNFVRLRKATPGSFLSAPTRGRGPQDAARRQGS